MEELLCPQLWPDAAVVMDNLPAHKVEGVCEAIEEDGAHLIYLSPYFADFNPVENYWSKLKAYLQKMTVHGREALNEASEVFNLVTRHFEGF